jgi:hypothetical protein
MFDNSDASKFSSVVIYPTLQADRNKVSSTELPAS